MTGRSAIRCRAIAARCLLAVLLAIAGATLTGCGPARTPGDADEGRLRVVAAENVWGSIAASVGGDRVHVRSLVSNRNIDPHEYEPTVADARAIADASVLVMNGAGYDPWVGQLAAASPDDSRSVVDVGALAGAAEGSNPHLWFSPTTVHLVARRLADEYARADPAGATYYRKRLRSFQEEELADYDRLIAALERDYAGTKVGASESIFLPLADALGLHVVTPEAFIDGVSEGTDPTAASKTAADAQIRRREIAVFVYNDQNATPDVAALVSACEREGIPVVTVSETIPASKTFGEWQVAQLEELRAALEEATGR